MLRSKSSLWLVPDPPPDLPPRVGYPDPAEEGWVDWLPIGLSGKLLMCLKTRQEVLTQSAANILEFMSFSNRTTWMILGDPALEIVHALDGWQDEKFPVCMTVLAGDLAGFSAVGAASNIKQRTRVAQLALAVAILIEGSPMLVESAFARFPECAPALLNLATQAYMNKQSKLCDTLDPPPDRRGICGILAHGFSLACVRDHYFELRQCDNQLISGRCFACGVYFSVSHLSSAEHQRQRDWKTQPVRASYFPNYGLFPC
jgi:hypothetical protein